MRTDLVDRLGMACACCYPEGLVTGMLASINFIRGKAVRGLEQRGSLQCLHEHQGVQ